jgi:hypothetical protein
LYRWLIICTAKINIIFYQHCHNYKAINILPDIPQCPDLYLPGFLYFIQFIQAEVGFKTPNPGN